VHSLPTSLRELTQNHVSVVEGQGEVSLARNQRQIRMRIWRWLRARDTSPCPSTTLT
jgi:hypothetical protein